MTKSQQLGRASAILSFLGFIISKLQYIPLASISALFSLLAPALYIGGHACWLTANIIEPDSEKRQKNWRDLIKTKKFILIASIIAIIATGLSVAADFLPVLLPPASWLFFVGNMFWIAGEHHKSKNPPQDADFCMEQQKARIDYATATACMSLVTAVASTLIFIVPPFMIPITIIAVTLSAGLGYLACESFIKMNFTAKKQDTSKSSYTYIESHLCYAPSQENRPTLSPNQDNHPPLFPEQAPPIVPENNVTASPVVDYNPTR